MEWRRVTLAVLIPLVFASAAGAMPSRLRDGSLRLEGSVVSFGDSTVIVRSGNELYEIRTDQLLSPARESLRVGVSTALVYPESAQQAYPFAEPAKHLGESAGQAGPELPSKPVLDDRAFYNALNERHDGAPICNLLAASRPFAPL
jgi:hypothetical protein